MWKVSSSRYALVWATMRFTTPRGLGVLVVLRCFPDFDVFQPLDHMMIVMTSCGSGGLWLQTSSSCSCWTVSTGKRSPLSQGNASLNPNKWSSRISNTLKDDKRQTADFCYVWCHRPKKCVRISSVVAVITQTCDYERQEFLVLCLLNWMNVTKSNPMGHQKEMRGNVRMNLDFDEHSHTYVERGASFRQSGCRVCRKIADVEILLVCEMINMNEAIILDILVMVSPNFSHLHHNNWTPVLGLMSACLNVWRETRQRGGGVAAAETNITS